MTEQWKELKETIMELRDNNGTCTQQEMCKFLANLMDILEKQMSRSENPNNWILVSEGLPEDEQEILFSTKTGRVYIGKYRDDDGVNQWYSYKDKCRAQNNVVSAWMPLPEPYKASPTGAGSEET